MDSFSVFKQSFNQLFLAYLDDKSNTIPEFDGREAIVERLVLLASDGKRLRPFVAYTASGESAHELASSPLLHMLYGIELYHLFALIHDDLIDESDIRHGVRTLHREFGMTQALLIGDLCLSWAHECIATYYDTPYVSVIFSALSEETILGQLLETTISSMTTPTRAVLDRTIELKTARYTFIYPLFLGRTFITETIDAESVTLVRFGRFLGHAFQRLDNMADVFLEELELGKEPCTDFRNGVSTHLSLFIQEWGTVVEQSTFSVLFGNRDASTTSIRALLITAGAYTAEKRAIAKLLANARTVLVDISEKNRWEPFVAMLESKLNML